MEELDLFFEYEKHDTLDEFVLNFELFILDFENKTEVISYLIKLFSLEKKQLKHFKYQEVEQQNLNQLRSQIKKCKKIIYYLKNAGENLRKHKDNDYKHFEPIKRQVPEVEKIKVVKKERVRKEFSEEVINLANSLLVVEDLFDYLDKNLIEANLVSQLLSYFKICTDQLIHKKIELRSMHKYDFMDEVQRNLKQYKKISQELILYKSRIRVEKTESNNREFFDILKCEVDPLLQQLKIVEDKTDVLSNIINLYKAYLQKEKAKYGVLIRQEAEIINSLRDTHSDYVDEIKREYSLQLKEIGTNIKFLANKCNYYSEYFNRIKQPKKESSVQFMEELQLSSVQDSIKDNLLQGKYIDGFEFTDVLYALGGCIKHEVINQYLLNYAKDITIKIVYEEIKDDSIIDAIYYVWDAIKYRLSVIPKDEVEARKILKDIRRLFDSAIKNYKESEQIVQHDYLFNLIDYFLGEEDYFLYLKKIVEVMPNVVNTRYTNRKNKTSGHVVLYIVDKFIENYRIMLYDHNKDYINKDYLKSVYFLFTRCYMLYLTDEEKKIIDNKLAYFMGEVNKNITSTKRKYAVKEDLRGMYTDKFYINQKVNKLEYVDEYALENYFNSFFLSIKDTLKFEKNRVDCTKEMTFTLGCGYHAYSIKREGEDFVLKIHVIDLYNLIPIPTSLSKYIFNQTATNSSVDDMIIRQINMEKDESYPTITYEIRFDGDGNYKDENNGISDLQIYLSKIRINQKYSDYDLAYSNSSSEFKLCMELYRKSFIRNGQYCNQYLLEDVEKHFEGILGQGVEKCFNERQLPFIYSGVEHYSEKRVVDIMSNVCHILSRLDRNEFQKVYKVLSSNVDSFHYSTEKFDGDYQLAIMDPLSYPGLLIQKVLHELVLENRFTEEEYERVVQKFSNKFDEVVANLNYHLDYVDLKTLQDNKGKLVKVKQMFF